MKFVFRYDFQFGLCWSVNRQYGDILDELTILGFFAENQQISYADHDYERIIRRKTLLPRNFRDTEGK